MGKSKNECDKKMLGEMRNMKSKDAREHLDMASVYPAIWAKHQRGLGTKPNKVKRR